MRPGRLRQVVDIETAAEARDENGQPIQTWSLYVRRMGAVEPINGREYFISAQEKSEITTRIRIRADRQTRSITPKMRAVFDGRTFDIHSRIDPQERHKEIVLMCSEEL